ncbi:MAG TPA: undecaprenyl-diphosphate phosphatase [Bacilli bacterium]|nr:MAG: Undecaprenyl-diphosphatase [Tenericutes bacterium ADurb.BinA124]HNZ50297.1 undecaprenyl-diphosphate phosphatase [Bacilli bacterium]HPX83656.1 undecaprenyl-diphosphate phosphatase [Bacilli bacterium]HQC74273.1 undecaprenyl-diphosphate phosphatase [Bacilli bacterium]
MEKVIEFIKYLMLGFVQGITEPLPVSSSGHMVIFDQIFGHVISPAAMNNFQIAVNFASLLAIIIYYRHLLKELIVGCWQFLFKKNKDQKPAFLYLVYIILATIPAGIVGLIIKLMDWDQYFTNILVVGISLLITGSLLMWIAKKQTTALRETITWKDALLMGGAQVVGLLPGISRSGITSAVGVSNKLQLEKALRFSFMMYIPASIAAAFLGVYDLIKPDTTATEPVFWLGYLGGFLASLISTYIAITVFFKLVKHKNIKYFGFYCLAVATIVLILIATGVFKW